MVGLFVNLLWNFEIGVTVSLIFSCLESIQERKQTNAQNTYIKILSLQEISFCDGLSFWECLKAKADGIEIHFTCLSLNAYLQLRGLFKF